MAGPSPRGGLSPHVQFYMEVSNTLTEDEVKQLRDVLVTDKHLSKAQVEKANSAAEIFSALDEANKIGKGNLKILADFLRGLGKNKLAQEAEEVAKRGEYDDEAEVVARRRPMQGDYKYEAKSMAERRQMKESSVAVHSNLGTYIMISVGLIVLLFGVLLASHMVGQNPVPQQDEMAGKDQDIQQLRDEMNQRIQTEMQQLKEEMASKEQRFHTEIEQLKTELAERIQQQQGDLQRLNGEDVAKDHRIKALEQRNYIERCESGVIALHPDALNKVQQMDVKETFSKGFHTEPVVTIGLTHVDHSPKQVRVNAAIVSKSTKGLTVRFETWNDSNLYRAMVYWMACA